MKQQQQKSPNFICVEICTEKVKKKKTCDDCARVPLLDLLKNYY